MKNRTVTAMYFDSTTGVNINVTATRKRSGHVVRYTFSATYPVDTNGENNNVTGIDRGKALSMFRNEIATYLRENW